MHFFSHSLIIDTRLDAEVFAASLRDKLAVLDPERHIEVDVRLPRGPEGRRLRRELGRSPSLVGGVRMTAEADASALVRSLLHVLQPEQDSWLQLMSIDGTVIDLWPGANLLTPLPERPAILKRA